jgi:arylsulfatase A-like enzyme
MPFVTHTLRLPSLLLAALLLILSGCSTDQPPPNILWIVVEDQSDHYGPYGETLAKTPNVDRLAAEGVMFSNAFVTAPVCSPARSALITGMYQTSIGAHHHRSSRGTVKNELAADVHLIPELFKEAGYFVTNGRLTEPGSDKLGPGKTDYNFVYPDDLYDGSDWSERSPGQPFFAQVQLRGGKFRDQQTLEPREGVHTNGIDPADVTLPPYYPDDPVIRKDWARYLESVEHVDWEVGRLLKRLEDEGIADNTVVIFFTDHGVSHARGKQFLYEEGIKIPLIVRGPGVSVGTARNDLVAHIDISATALDLAGVAVPETMQGRPLFGPDAQPRDYVVSARDRCDETVEYMRSVRTDRYKYIRNFLPQRPHLQPNRYKDGKAIIQAIRKLHAEGELDPHQERLFTVPRPDEEFYELESDPHELTNLASDPAHQETLQQLRQKLDEWIETSGDRGPESLEAYDSDMAVYLGSRTGPQRDILVKNIETMKAWAAEGK